MNKFILLVYLYDDPQNDLISRVRYVEGEDRVSLLGHDGVIQLSNNALLFDHTKSHDIYVRLCQDLVSLNRPYLICPLCLDDALVVGKLPKEVQASLLTYGVHFLDRAQRE